MGLLTLIFILMGVLLYVMNAMKKRVDRMEREIATLTEELDRQRLTGKVLPAVAEAGAAEPIAGVEGEVAPMEVPQVITAAGEQAIAAEANEPEAIEPEREPQSEPEPAMAARTVAPAAVESLESRLGARWPVWAGGLALALG
eukprot:gene54692-74947_t